MWVSTRLSRSLEVIEGHMDPLAPYDFLLLNQSNNLVFLNRHITYESGIVVVVVVVEMNIIKVALSHFCCRTTVYRTAFERNGNNGQDLPRI